PGARGRVEPAGADRQPAGAQRRDRGRERRSESGQRHACAGAVALRSEIAGSTGSGSRRRYFVPARRMGAGGLTCRFFVADGERQDQVLRAGADGGHAAHGRRGDRAVRRLRVGHRGDDTFHRTPGRVHAARDLQQGESREPRVPGRGEAGRVQSGLAPGTAGRGGSVGPGAVTAPPRHSPAAAERAADVADAPRGTAIDVHGLTKRYGGRAVVDNFSIRVERGTIFGFLGPNGSGKTTTIRMLCGLLTPDEGEGTCLGYDLRRDAAAIKRQVGYMTQRFSLYEDLSIEENLDFVARMYGVAGRKQTIDATLDRLGLTA